MYVSIFFYFSQIKVGDFPALFDICLAPEWQNAGLVLTTLIVVLLLIRSLITLVKVANNFKS
ncbi:MAG: hypothetical protein AB4368_04325 [Xenococcaceae cyanobacterium]